MHACMYVDHRLAGIHYSYLRTNQSGLELVVIIPLSEVLESQI